MSKSDDQILDDLFTLGRAQEPTLSDALMARIVQDAQSAHRVEQTPERSAWAGLFELLGGWPAVGGFAVAGVTGIWFGVAPPAPVSSFAADLIGTTVTVDLLDDTNAYFVETLIDG